MSCRKLRCPSSGTPSGSLGSLDILPLAELLASGQQPFLGCIQRRNWPGKELETLDAVTRSALRKSTFPRADRFRHRLLSRVRGTSLSELNPGLFYVQTIVVDFFVDVMKNPEISG